VRLSAGDPLLVEQALVPDVETIASRAKVGQAGSLRPIGNRQVEAFASSQAGRLRSGSCLCFPLLHRVVAGAVGHFHGSLHPFLVCVRRLRLHSHCSAQAWVAATSRLWRVISHRHLAVQMLKNRYAAARQRAAKPPLVDLPLPFSDRYCIVVATARSVCTVKIHSKSFRLQRRNAVPFSPHAIVNWALNSPM
jgi:hypothetical protein